MANSVHFSRVTLTLFQQLNFARNREGRIPLKGNLTIPITSGWVDPCHLYAQVFNHRQTYLPVIKELHKDWLEDPLDEVPEVKAYAEKLIRKFKPQTELEKAILLFRSIIRKEKEFDFDRKKYSGLKREEGGLEIRFDDDANAHLRLDIRPVLLPKDYIDAPYIERVAVCHEYSFLVIALLRAVGIKAHMNKPEVEHLNVIAQTDKGICKIDAVIPSFELIQKLPDTLLSESKCIAHYYNRKGETIRRRAQGIKMNEEWLARAMEALMLALEIDPDLAPAWNNMGLVMLEQGRLEPALSAVDKALKLDPNLAHGWNARGVILDKMGKIDEAEKAYRKALEIDPDRVEAKRNLDRLLGKSDLFSRLMGISE